MSGEKANDKTPQNKNSAIVVNQIKLDAKTPVPLQISGDVFKYSYQGQPYIPFLDAKDNMALLCLEARLNSPTHNLCINNIVESAIGDGVSIKDNENPNSDFVNWLKNINNNQEEIDDVITDVMQGERSSGNHFIEVICGQVGNKKYMKVYAHNIRYCRFDKINEKTGLPENVIYSRSFGKKGNGASTIKFPDDNRLVPYYNANAVDDKVNWKIEANGERRTMIHVVNKYQGIDFYGLPNTISCIREQVQEGKLSQFNIDNMDNNMVIGGVLVFKSSMTQQEANKQGRQIIKTHTGEGNAGRIAVVSSEEGIDAFEYKSFDTHKEGSYLELDKRNEAKIIASHNWAREFCYSDVASMGKGANYLRNLWNLKEKSLLKPLRKKIIRQALKPIAKIYAEWFGVKEVADYVFEFKSNSPFNFVSDLKPSDFMQVNEARDLAGYPVDAKKEGVYISEMNKNNQSNGNVSPESSST